MCEYCKNISTGNYFKAILEGDIEGDINGYYNVYLGRRTGKKPTLQADVTLLNTPIVMDAIPIRYCPMCGCDLKEVKDA